MSCYVGTGVDRNKCYAMRSRSPSTGDCSDLSKIYCDFLPDNLCKWDNQICVSKEATIGNCSDFNDDEGSCEAHAGCEWDNCSHMIRVGEECDLGNPDSVDGGMNGVEGSGCDEWCNLTMVINSSDYSAYWAYMNGTETSEMNEGRYVKLILDWDYIGPVDFKIYKEEDDSLVKEISSGDGVGFWAAGEDSQGNFERGDYYFKAVLDFGNEEGEIVIKSESLEVTEEVPNVPPVAKIVHVDDRGIYFLGENMRFFQESYDEDGLFDYTWELGGEKNKTGSSRDEDWDFVDYTFVNPGQKVVKLTVEDNNGAKSSDMVTFLVMNSTYSLSYIDAVAVDGRRVKFDASGSYVVSYDHEGNTLTCLGGLCPDKSSGCPPDFSDGEGDCRVEVDNSGLDGDNLYNNLRFIWRFSDGWTKQGLGSSGPLESYKFKRKFGSAGDHWAELRVELVWERLGEKEDFLF